MSLTAVGVHKTGLLNGARNAVYMAVNGVLWSACLYRASDLAQRLADRSDPPKDSRWRLC